VKDEIARIDARRFMLSATLFFMPAAFPTPPNRKIQGETVPALLRGTKSGPATTSPPTGGSAPWRTRRAVENCRSEGNAVAEWSDCWAPPALAQAGLISDTIVEYYSGKG
jgi:hypothetical protein